MVPARWWKLMNLARCETQRSLEVGGSKSLLKGAATPQLPRIVAKAEFGPIFARLANASGK